MDCEAPDTMYVCSSRIDLVLNDRSGALASARIKGPLWVIGVEERRSCHLQLNLQNDPLSATLWYRRNRHLVPSGGYCR